MLVDRVDSITGPAMTLRTLSFPRCSDGEIGMVERAPQLLFTEEVPRVRAEKAFSLFPPLVLFPLQPPPDGDACRGNGVVFVADENDGHANFCKLSSHLAVSDQ